MIRMDALTINIVATVFSGVMVYFITKGLNALLSISPNSDKNFIPQIEGAIPQQSKTLGEQLNERAYTSPITYSIVTITMLYLALYIPNLFWFYKQYGFTYSPSIFSLQLAYTAFGAYIILNFITQYTARFLIRLLVIKQYALNASDMQKMRYAIYLILLYFLMVLYLSFWFHFPMKEAFQYVSIGGLFIVIVGIAQMSKSK
jgi:hypothetical protein